jgi:pilus assembly protein FimV
MKKTQRDTYTPSEDFEDLTLFANESFDTQDVDLFEFTSEESSPLTRLKSIILSLDWEINDEILQELADELVSLQAMWQGDKVAEVYLQGLAKIGNYIRTKGAYAHPNSIKLLLTFFYNFEKIISSPTITGDQITQLLKGDVRKFKILQYQITQSEAPAQEETPELEPSIPSMEQPALATEEPTPAQQLKASILGLDWEVTEESLMQFNATLLNCHQHMTGNKAALVLLQGLQALGDYISEERANSHPDAFTLLHAFDEALDQVGQSGESGLDQSEIQDLLVDRINRLNSLKMEIASPHNGPVDEQLIADVVDEISTPTTINDTLSLELSLEEVDEPLTSPPTAATLTEPGPTDTVSLGDELDSIFGLDTAMPAMETADVQYPDEILPPDAIHPVDDELADDLIGAQLSTSRGLAPALGDTDEVSDFCIDEANHDLPAQDDLTAQLDFLFAECETTAEVPESTHTSETVADDEGDIDLAFSSEPIAALSDVDELLIDVDPEEEPLDLAIAEPIDANSLEIESKLDSFFAAADTVAEPSQAEVADETVEEIEQALFFDEPTSPAAALADTEEQGGFSEEEAVTALGHSPMDEIEEKLDFFFGDELESVQASDDVDRLILAEAAAPAPALNDFVQEQMEESEEPVAALSHVPPTNELDGALDLFFADSEETSPSEEPLATMAESGEFIVDEPGEGTATLETVRAVDAITAVDDLTSAVERGIVAEGPIAPPEERQIHLAALGAVLPLAVRTLARDKISQSQEMLTTLQQSGGTDEHRALAQLLQSVLTMLARLPAKDEEDTEQLVNYLYEQLLTKALPPSTLVEAIGHFSTWLQQAGTLMPLVPATTGQPDEPTDPQYHYTAKELYFELAELRLHMKEEFAKIRHELQHHH